MNTTIDRDDLAGGTKPGDALSSPAIGSSGTDLIESCSAEHQPHASRPTYPPTGAIAVALSGGGFRASLSGLGVLRLLADCNLLGDVRYVSSVSGGSVAHGLLAHHYDALKREGFTGEALDRLVIDPFMARISADSLVWELVRNVWRIVGRETRTELLADSFSKWFFGERPLASLPPDVRFVFNAANLSSGVRFTLEREIVGDYVVGYLPTQTTNLRLADAVAASAAFPGAFSPLVLSHLQFPCEDTTTAPPVNRTPKLLDGGAYDNMGLESIDDLTRGELIVALNAGGVFRTGTRFGRVPILRDLMRVNSLLYRQSTALRRSEMVERFRAWEHHRDGEALASGSGAGPPVWARRGVLFGLTTTFEKRRPGGGWDVPDRPERAELIEQLAKVKTTFARFSKETCVALAYRGWWLTGATLATFHRDVLPAELPQWRALLAERGAT